MVMAFKAFSNNEFAAPALALKCVATRPESAWNFESTVGSGWLTVRSTIRGEDRLPSNWFAMNYTGSTSGAFLNTFPTFNLTQSSCGVVDQSNKIQPGLPSTWFVGFRRLVDQYCETFAPTASPVTPSPTLLALNTQDLAGFNALSSALGRVGGGWTDCDLNSDPCFACTSNDENHAVICEEAPTSVPGRRVLNGQVERRIVGLRFRNLNISGVVPVTALGMFSAIREINFSSVLGDPNPNNLQLPESVSCIDIARCAVAGVTCDFGPEAPLCNGAQTRSNGGPSGNPSDPVLIGGVIAAVLTVLGVVVLLVVRRRMSSSSRASGPQNPAHLRNRELSNAKGRSTFRKSSVPMQSLWREEFDVASGTKFWTNTATGEFTWSSPFTENLAGDESKQEMKEEAAVPSAQPDEHDATFPIFSGKGRFSQSWRRSRASQRGAADTSGQWTAVADEANGTRYWVNNVTGEFSYVKPSDDDALVVHTTSAEGDDTAPMSSSSDVPVVVASRRRTKSSGAGLISTRGTELAVPQVVEVDEVVVSGTLNRKTGEFSVNNPLVAGSASTTMGSTTASDPLSPAPRIPSFRAKLMRTQSANTSSAMVPRQPDETDAEIDRRTGEFEFTRSPV